MQTSQVGTSLLALKQLGSFHVGIKFVTARQTPPLETPSVASRTATFALMALPFLKISEQPSIIAPSWTEPFPTLLEQPTRKEHKFYVEAPAFHQVVELVPGLEGSPCYPQS